jgi:hypothetical protein
MEWTTLSTPEANAQPASPREASVGAEAVRPPAPYLLGRLQPQSRPRDQTPSARRSPAMLTLCIRYTIDPNKLAAFRHYVEAEQDPIRRSGGKTLGYFLPTDFAGPTNEALGLIEFPTLDDYATYRRALADDPDHKRNVAELERSGVIVAMNRSLIERI